MICQHLVDFRNKIFDKIDQFDIKQITVFSHLINVDSLSIHCVNYVDLLLVINSN